MLRWFSMPMPLSLDGPPAEIAHTVNRCVDASSRLTLSLDAPRGPFARVWLWFAGICLAYYCCTLLAIPAGGGEVLGGGLSIQKAPFGTTKGGQAVELYTLRNASGVTAKVMTYGAIILSLEVPDRDGRLVNVTANRETLEDYETRSACFGSLIGRYANRIARGQFTLDGHPIALARNGGPHHIHGGNRGFDKRVWQAETTTESDAVALKLTYRSPDGEEGYPGTLDCVVRYELNNRNEWKMDYSARTDKPTVVNFSNHAYWNLAGAQSGTVLEQELTVNADKYLAVDDTLIPTGGTLPVAGTPVDFREPHRIGERIGQIRERQFLGGYDHCLVVNHLRAGDLTFGAKLKDPKSGRVMEVWTTEPGIQLYSANFPSGSIQGPHGYPYPEHAGLCLETQHYPDSPNHPEFPTTVLRPGETYHSTTVHKFSVERF
jgi:aldose 1-epimerase